MSDLQEAPVKNSAPTQAIELSWLVDLEAHWENLRKTWPGAHETGTLLNDLQERQKAYDAFHRKLVAYNKQYSPAHVPELLLNTPLRLRIWCRSMRNLYVQVEQDPKGHCPVHLVEKAYRWADRIGVRMNRECVNRKPRPGTIGEVILELEAVEQWCGSDAGLAATA